MLEPTPAQQSYKAHTLRKVQTKDHEPSKLTVYLIYGAFCGFVEINCGFVRSDCSRRQLFRVIQVFLCELQPFFLVNLSLL